MLHLIYNNKRKDLWNMSNNPFVTYLLVFSAVLILAGIIAAPLLILINNNEKKFKKSLGEQIILPKKKKLSIYTYTIRTNIMLFLFFISLFMVGFIYMSYNLYSSLQFVTILYAPVTILVFIINNLVERYKINKSGKYNELNIIDQYIGKPRTYCYDLLEKAGTQAHLTLSKRSYENSFSYISNANTVTIGNLKHKYRLGHGHRNPRFDDAFFVEITLPKKFEGNVTIMKSNYIKDNMIVPDYSNIPLIEFQNCTQAQARMLINSDVQKEIAERATQLTGYAMFFKDNKIGIILLDIRLPAAINKMHPSGVVNSSKEILNTLNNIACKIGY